MDFLRHLDDHQRRTLVRLPYRIGLWISQSDQSGGEEARARELQTLSNIIHGFAQEIFSSEDVQHIMSEAVMKKSEWPAWEENLEKVPDECRAVIESIKPYADRKDIAALSNHLLEIGEAVASAFCERSAGSLASWFSYKLNRRAKGHRHQSFKEYLSISAAERAALKSVASALGTSY